MTVETLSKFGVPHSGGQLGMLQPKVKYRFRVVFIDFGSGLQQGDLTRQVVSVGKPSLKHPPQEVHSYNSTAYYAGKHNWDEINIVLRDDISNRVSFLVGSQVQKQLNHYEQTGFSAGINYKFTMLIDTLDGGNTIDTPGTRGIPGVSNGILERWTLEGCFITSVEWGDLDYSSSDAQTISLSIRPDNCTYVGHAEQQVLMPTGDENLESQAGRPASAVGPTSVL
jgi:hypothetical protein